MKLGMLKTVADKIPALLFAVCGEGDARCGPKDDTLAAANERISHMGRLILATIAPPGYVKLLLCLLFRFIVELSGSARAAINDRLLCIISVTLESASAVSGVHRVDRLALTQMLLCSPSCLARFILCRTGTLYERESSSPHTKGGSGATGSSTGRSWWPV